MKRKKRESEKKRKKKKKETFLACMFCFSNADPVTLPHRTVSCKCLAFGLPYLLVELFYIGIPVVRTVGWAYGHMITKISRMGSVRDRK